MRISELMSTDVATSLPDELATAAEGRMRLKNIRHLVVMEGRRVAGVVTANDLARARPGALVSDVMSAAPITTGPRTAVSEAANLLRGNLVSCLPVLDHEKLVGIVTVSDLLEVIGRGRGKADRTATIRNGRRFDGRQLRHR